MKFKTVIALGLIQTTTVVGQEAPQFAQAQRVVDQLTFPTQMALADWNGDGNLDAMVSGDGEDRVGVFPGDGQGGFGWLRLQDEVAMDADWRDMVAADWDGDGLQDVLACELGGLHWLRLGEQGELLSRTLLRSGVSPVRLSVGDANADGRLDVAFVDSDQDEAVLLFGGEGGAIQDSLIDASVASATVVGLGDWSGDGVVDWLYGSYTTGELFLRQGDGFGGFQPRQTVADYAKLSALDIVADEGAEARFFVGVDDAFALEVFPNGSAPDTLGSFAGVSRFAMADFDGDGWDDVALASNTNQSCAVLYGLPEGGFSDDIWVKFVAQIRDVDAGDVDGDGRAELFVCSRSRGSAGTYDFNPDATTYTPLLEGLQYVRNCVAGDINGDGLDDVITMVQGSNLFDGGPEYLNVALSSGDGSFDVSYVSPGTYFGYDVVLADYDMDGDLDLAVSDYNGDRVVGLRNDGAGHFVLADTLIADIDKTDDLVMADLNGDEWPDLVAASWTSSNNVRVALNVGLGQFAVPFSLPGTGNRCEAVAVDDFNGDGSMDIAGCFENSGNVKVWLGTDATGLSFSTPQTLTLPSAQDMGVGDWDGDGDVDLFAVGYNETDVVVFANDGQGNFAEGQGMGMMDVDAALGLTIGDADGDGLAEAVVSEYGGGRTRLFHGATGTTVTLAEGSGPQNASFGDFDGDGDADVALTLYSGREVLWAELLSGMQPPFCYGGAEFLDFIAHYQCVVPADGCETHDLDGNGVVGVPDLLRALASLASSCP